MALPPIDIINLSVDGILLIGIGSFFKFYVFDKVARLEDQLNPSDPMNHFITIQEVKDLLESEIKQSNELINYKLENIESILKDIVEVKVKNK